MATKFLFNNKTASKPDVYAQTKSGITNAAQALPYGNILIIDTGSGAEFWCRFRYNWYLKTKSRFCL